MRRPWPNSKRTRSTTHNSTRCGTRWRGCTPRISRTAPSRDSASRCAADRSSSTICLPRVSRPIPRPVRLAAYALITELADIGFDTIAKQLGGADWSWVVIAFVFAQLTNVGEYVSLTGMVARPVPFAPTIMFRYAIAFVGLAVPGDAGAIAMNVRYMQKLGVSASAAVAQGPLLVIVSKLVDVVLLVLSARFLGESVHLHQVRTGTLLRLLVWVGLAVTIGVVLMFSVPKIRDLVVPPIREGFGAIK